MELGCPGGCVEINTPQMFVSCPYKTLTGPIQLWLRFYVKSLFKKKDFLQKW